MRAISVLFSSGDVVSRGQKPSGHGSTFSKRKAIRGGRYATGPAMSFVAAPVSAPMSETFAIRHPPAVRSFGLPCAKALKDSRTGEGSRGLGLRRQNRVWIGAEPSIKMLELARRPRPGITTSVVIVIVRDGVGNMSARAGAQGRAGRMSAAVWERRND